MNSLLCFLVIVQLDAQIPFSIFIYISLHVSSMSCSSLGEKDCINTASGKCHSVLVAVSEWHLQWHSMHFYFWWSLCTLMLVYWILITLGVVRKEGVKFHQDTFKTSDAIFWKTQMVGKARKVWLYLYQRLPKYGTDLTVLIWLLVSDHCEAQISFYIFIYNSLPVSTT